jgi:hypothetical protein
LAADAATCSNPLLCGGNLLVLGFVLPVSIRVGHCT